MSTLTIRTRLTLVYGGLFLLAGILLLAVTYALVSQRPPDSGQGRSSNDTAGTYTFGSDQAKPIVGQITEDTWHNALEALLTQGAIALAVVGAGAIAIGWLVAGRLLQPLHRVTETARRIAKAPAADRELHERIALSGPADEIKELADTFDLMLEHLDRSFDGQRRFISNASHELRTPLAVNRALLEVALRRDPDSPQTRQLAETLLDVNTRHEQLISGLLLLARAEPEVTEHSYVDIADIAEHVVANSVSTEVSVEVEAVEAPTTGNPVLLERLVHNLVENGVRYNQPEGWVRVATRTDVDGSAEITVSNTGPVVPGLEVSSLFEPFRRLDPQRLSPTGAGLGLSIVKAIARAHGGKVTARPRATGGLLVTVVLPGAGTD